MLRLIANNEIIPVTVSVYPDGALGVNISGVSNCTFESATVTVMPENKVAHVIELLMLFFSALRHNKITIKEIALSIPYMPYARADRVFNDGDGYPLQTFLNSLNAFGFSRIYTIDLHNKNELYDMYLPNLIEFQQHELPSLKHALKWGNYDLIIAPDKGAKPKIKKLYESKVVDSIPLLTATKERDSNGRIKSVTFDSRYLNIHHVERILIIDDILDGGGTYLPLIETIKALQPKANIDIHVSHLIASDGLSKFAGKFNKIFCYQTVSNYVTMDVVRQFNERKYS